MKALVVMSIAVPAILVVVGMVVSTISATRPHLASNTSILKEHTRLTAKAARRYRKGRDGEANIYAEAAERLIKTLNQEEKT